MTAEEKHIMFQIFPFYGLMKIISVMIMPFHVIYIIWCNKIHKCLNSEFKNVVCLWTNPCSIRLFISFYL